MHHSPHHIYQPFIWSVATQRPAWALQRLLDSEVETKLAQDLAVTKDVDKPLRCYRCQHKITTQQQAISMAGQHQHCVNNPAGVQFVIACFAQATGCVDEGIPTTEFTWFQGFAWNYAYCRNCRMHLGWHYQAMDGNAFYGLIVDRLQAG